MAQKKYASLASLQTFLDNIKTKFASISHKHKLSDITDYTVDVELSPTSNNPVANKVLDAEFNAIGDAMGALELAIDGKAVSGHTHDDRYYTENEVDEKLAGKANSSHTHSIANVTNLQSSLDAKVPTSRTINGKALSENISLNASDVGAAASSHSHDDRYYTESEIDSKLASKSDSTHNHDSKYDAKGSAADSLTSAKAYTDTKVSGLASTTVVDNKIGAHNSSASAHNDIRDLITGLTTRLNTLANSDDTTLDQMSEVVAYIKNNKNLIDGITTSKVNVADIVNNLTTNVTNKPLSAAQGVAIKGLIDALQEDLDSHGHAISDVSGLQSALDGKAASSHGTHVSYSTTAPVMDGTASVGSASTVARSDHKHPTDTSRAAKSDLDSHINNKSNPHEVKLSQLGVTATATELNYLDGAIRNVQAQLDERRTHWVECGSEVILSSRSISNNATLSNLTNVTPPDCIVVTFDNVEYKCTMWTNSDGENCYGDSRITTMYDEGTGTLVTDMTNPENTPFYINACADDGADFNLVWTWHIVFNSNISSTSHTVKINEAEYHTISENFIPSTIARKSDMTQVQIITWEADD